MKKSKLKNEEVVFEEWTPPRKCFDEYGNPAIPMDKHDMFGGNYRIIRLPKNSPYLRGKKIPDNFKGILYYGMSKGGVHTSIRRRIWDHSNDFRSRVPVDSPGGLIRQHLGGDEYDNLYYQYYPISQESAAEYKSLYEESDIKKGNSDLFLKKEQEHIKCYEKKNGRKPLGHKDNSNPKTKQIREQMKYERCQMYIKNNSKNSTIKLDTGDIGKGNVVNSESGKTEIEYTSEWLNDVKNLQVKLKELLSPEQTEGISDEVVKSITSIFINDLSKLTESNKTEEKTNSSKTREYMSDEEKDLKKQLVYLEISEDLINGYLTQDKIFWDVVKKQPLSEVKNALKDPDHPLRSKLKVKKAKRVANLVRGA